MNLFKYKNYAWILLLPIAALLIYAAIDLWGWHKSTDADIFEEFLKTLPQPADSGRTIAVISNVDSTEWELLRGYAGISPEAGLILEPDSLYRLARMLQTLAKVKLVARLTFFGVGDTSEGKKVELRFTKQQPRITRDDFIKLREKYPDLPSAFNKDAQVVFFNCWAGSDTALLKAAGEAFLLHKGGFVIANPKLTKFEISSGGMFWSKESAIITWIDRPGETKWDSLKIQAKSNSLFRR